MEKEILTRVRKMNWVLQESSAGTFSFDELCGILSDMLDSNVYIIATDGTVMAVRYKLRSDSSAIQDPITGIEKLPAEYNDGLLDVNETLANLKGEAALRIFKYDFETSHKFHTIIPISCGGERLGTFVAVRPNPIYNDEDLVLAEVGATVVGLEIQRRHAREAEETERLRREVKKAIGTMSYSEFEAVQCIFGELGGMDGLLVASKVADRSGITRSVIVNALRKLESAGIIESRSLGMKGTHIKILNAVFMEELSTISK